MTPLFLRSFGKGISRIKAALKDKEGAMMPDLIVPSCYISNVTIIS